MHDEPTLPRSPTVFISYSHDSADHKANVLNLANQLRTAGIDARLDQYIESPPEGWAKWMQQQLADCDFVLLVCTRPYRAGVEGTNPIQKGLGRRWEGALIYQHIYNAGSLNTRFIPVLIGDNDPNVIPLPLQGATWYRIDEASGYNALYRRMLGQPAVIVPPLGRSPESRSEWSDPLARPETHFTKSPLRVFLCHSSADKKAVRRLYRRLLDQGVAPWLDEENLLPGQDWDREIKDAIRATDVILVCLSRRATTRQGYLSREIDHALTAAHEKPADTLFLIPVRIGKCEAPLGLQKWQWVNLYEHTGYLRLVRALRERASEVGALVPREPLPDTGGHRRLILSLAGATMLITLAGTAYLELPYKTQQSRPDTPIHKNNAIPKNLPIVKTLPPSALEARLNSLPHLMGLRAHFINVGQGAATLIELPDAALLVDAGSEITSAGDMKEHLIDYLKAFFAKRPDLKSTLDALFISHGHMDHVSAVPDILANFIVRLLVDNGDVHPSGSGSAEIQRARTAFSSPGKQYIGIDSVKAAHGYEISLPFSKGRMSTIRVLSGARNCQNLNNDSLVLHIAVGASSILLPGDAETSDRKCGGLLPHLTDSGVALAADVLQVPQHGGSGGMDLAFFRQVSPRLAVISAGSQETRGPGLFHAFNYGHPRRALLNALTAVITNSRPAKDVYSFDGPKELAGETLSKAVYCTCWDGDVVVTMDGRGGTPRVDQF